MSGVHVIKYVLMEPLAPPNAYLMCVCVCAIADNAGVIVNNKGEMKGRLFFLPLYHCCTIPSYTHTHV